MGELNHPWILQAPVACLKQIFRLAVKRESIRFFMTSSTSCRFPLITLVISFHSLYPSLRSFSIFTSSSIVRNPCWLSLCISSLSHWPRPPPSSPAVYPYSPPNPFRSHSRFLTHNLCLSILLSTSAHPPSIHVYLSNPSCLHDHSSLFPTLPYSLPLSLHFPAIHHSSPSCLCQAELPGIHQEEV